MADLTEDIVELQTRLQFQDDTIQKLDEVIVRQAELLDKLVGRVQTLEERLEQLSFELESSAAKVDERPPHY